MNSSAKPGPYHILVNGDVVVDHHIYRGDCEHPEQGGCTTRIIRQHGGAGQTADLLDTMTKDEPLIVVHNATPKLSDQFQLDPEKHHAYATWTGFLPSKDPKEKKSDTVWRVNETFGFGTVESAK